MTNIKAIRRPLRVLLLALLVLALPAGAQGPGGDDTCAGAPDDAGDPTQVAFCWDPAEVEKLPADPPKKPVTPPGIKAPKEKKPGDPPPIPKGPASGTKGKPFRPK